MWSLLLTRYAISFQSYPVCTSMLMYQYVCPWVSYLLCLSETFAVHLILSILLWLLYIGWINMFGGNLYISLREDWDSYVEVGRFWNNSCSGERTGPCFCRLTCDYTCSRSRSCRGRFCRRYVRSCRDWSCLSVCSCSCTPCFVWELYSGLGRDRDGE